MELPNNGVTRMPIKNQQWEADLIAGSIQETEEELKRLQEEYVRRLAWIGECKRLGRV